MRRYRSHSKLEAYARRQYNSETMRLRALSQRWDQRFQAGASKDELHELTIRIETARAKAAVWHETVQRLLQERIDALLAGLQA